MLVELNSRFPSPGRGFSVLRERWIPPTTDDGKDTLIGPAGVDLISGLVLAGLFLSRGPV